MGVLNAVAAAFVLRLSTAAAQGAGNWKLQLVDNSTGKCLDGSPGGYWMSPGSGSGASKWIIHFQGGGWCTSLDDCFSRSGTNLGSSSSWPANPQYTSADGGEHGMISPDPKINPLFNSWNRVFVGYCTGDSWASNVASPVAVPGKGVVHFRGHALLDTVLASLGAAGLSKASEVIMKGCSAGGLTVYLHADYVAAFIAAINPVARFAAVPGAGFFLDYPGFDGKYHYRSNYQWVFSAMNASGTVNAACIAYYSAQPGSPTWMCYMAQYTLPFISSPLFVSNSLSDSWQGSNIMELPCDPNSNCNSTVVAYLDGFRSAMITALAPVLTSSGGGAYLQTCYVHVVEDIDKSWNGTAVGGKTQIDTFAAWYQGDTVNSKSVDSTWLPRNPTCY